LIIGVDFGATTAVAVVDLDGRPIAVASRRNWPFEGVLSFCSAYEAAFVSCDKKTPPRPVRQLNACFNAKLDHPDADLTLIEKLRITRNHSTRNQHERDALASALKCFHRRFQNQSRKISKRAPPELASKAKLFVARGNRFSSFKTAGAVSRPA